MQHSFSLRKITALNYRPFDSLEYPFDVLKLESTVRLTVENNRKLIIVAPLSWNW